jgi:hypothetical protein
LGDPAKIAPFMESMLGTLYGDVFSPREEFLIMELFKMCISTEIKNASHPKDMSESSSIVNTMILTYNKRRQGTEYLKATVGPVIKEITSKDDLNLNIDLKQVSISFVVFIFILLFRTLKSSVTKTRFANAFLLRSLPSWLLL